MARAAFLVGNVSSVSGRHNILAVKAGTSICLVGPPALLACLVCARYQHSCFIEVDFLQPNLFEQSTSLRYLWDNK
jgi:hypothetical protein